jgi:hypothetical protein
MRTGRPWTYEEEERLAGLYVAGWTNAQIGEALSRSRGAVGERLTRLRSLGKLTDAQPAVDLGCPPALGGMRDLRTMPVGVACRLHAEAVMAEGGFCALSEKPLGNGKWAVCLPLIWPKKEQTI